MTYHITATIPKSTFQSQIKTEDVWLRKDNFLPVQMTHHFSDANGHGQVMVSLILMKWNTGATNQIPLATPA